MTATSGVVTARPVIGILAMLANTVLIPIMGLAIKRLTAEGVGTLDMLSWRSFLILLALLPFLAAPARRSEAASADIRAHLVHAVFAISTMACFYFALRTLPIVTVTAINFTTPIFALLLARVMFHEQVSREGWLALLLGFTGTVVVLRPDASGIGLDAAVVLLGSALGAAMHLAVRRMPARSSNFAVVFYLALAGAVVYGILGAPVIGWPEPGEWVWLATLAIVALAIHTCTTLAFRFASSMLVGALDYLRIVWAFGIGLVALGEVPAPTDWAGIAMIVLSGGLVLRSGARVPRGEPV